jgi:hypothetical protein
MDDNASTEIMDQADALIRRHRVFVAGDGGQTAAALGEPNHADDDIPVLTEIVSDTGGSLATAPAHMQQHLEALREELSRWLNDELPQAVLKVTDGLADQLMAELTHQAEQKLLPRLIARFDGTAGVTSEISKNET